MDYLAGADLEPFKVPALTRCWWCGSSAPLTREHKFKLSDLKRMKPEEGLVWVGADRMRDITTIRRGSLVRFEPGICAKCNNERSQPFDNAYQAFSDFIWCRSALWRRRSIDMADIYGSEWAECSRLLGRYVAKHLGCRMAHERYPVPTSLGAFLDGTSELADVQMVLFKCRDYHRFYRRSRRGDNGGGGVGFTPAHGAVSRSKQRLTVYTAGLVVGFVGIMFRWEEGSDHGRHSFYHYRYPRLIKRHKLMAA